MHLQKTNEVRMKERAKSQQSYLYRLFVYISSILQQPFVYLFICLLVVSFPV